MNTPEGAQVPDAGDACEAIDASDPASPVREGAINENGAAPPDPRETTNANDAPRAREGATNENNAAPPDPHETTANANDAPRAREQTANENDPAPPSPHETTTNANDAPRAREQTANENDPAPPDLHETTTNANTAPRARESTTSKNNTAAPPSPGRATGASASSAADDEVVGGRWRRAAPLMGLTARTAGEAVVAGLRGKLTGTDRTEFHMRAAERYAELLGNSKGALMKAGQMLSFISAGPAVPEELQTVYQTALARLRDEAPPMAPALARVALERELGQRAEAAYAHFEWEPLAAASIGQVHAARLHDGREVAVKIQYPGVADAIDADLKNNDLLATLLAFLSGMAPKKVSFDVRGGAEELRARIVEELDYRHEATNQAEFAEHYRGHPFIHIPEIVPELCTGRVLTQELVQGLPWDQALTAEQRLRDRWAEAIERFTFGSNGRFCALNADPHPGNYVFHEDGSVSFLDFGCVKRFRREQVEMMHAIARTCLRGDVAGTWRVCVEEGFWRSSDPVTPEEVFAYWRESWRMYWAEQPFTITPEYAAEWIERKFSPNGPSANAFRHITASPEYTIWSRIEMGVASTLAQLRATNHWRSILFEYIDGAPALTEMGKRDQAFFAVRQAASSHA